MKGQVLGLVGILLVTLACAVGTPAPVATQPGVGTIVAETMQALTAVAPTATEVVQPSGTTVSLRNVSFVVPNGLATDANSEVVPAVSEEQGAPWDVGPEYLHFTLNGYPIPYGEGRAPIINIFPAQEFQDTNSGAGQSLPALKTLLADPSAALTAETIPAVPYYNAAQVITAQAIRLDFKSGSGIRTITFYAQYPGPILKDGQFYYYQGLTSDGKYYVIATLPLVSPLKSTADNPSADGVTYPDPASVANPSAYDMYYPPMTEILNAASPDSFSPSLNQIDALIQSITVTQ